MSLSRLLATGAVLCSLVTHPLLAIGDAPGQSVAPDVLQNYGRLPLHLEANEGQTDPQVKFLARGQGYTVFLTATETVLVLRANGVERDSVERPATVVRLRLEPRSTGEPQMLGLDELAGKANYFIGTDPRKWRTNIPLYARVKYRDVYPGVDAVYYGAGQRLECDFVIAPGADPDIITLEVTGADRLELDAAGDLVMHAGGGQVRLHKPLIYQDVDGTRRRIAGGYVRRGINRVGFHVAARDSGRPLVIDPVLDYSTYLGGAGSDQGAAIAVDGAGNAYVAGSTTSVSFPAVNALQPAFRGSQDAFVAKLGPTGSALVYSTYLGGSGPDAALGIAVDSAGNAYVTGGTGSGDFPTSATALQSAFGGLLDAFVTKLDATGSALGYSTYLGGVGIDEGRGIAVDASGRAYVAGITSSPDFPTANAVQAAPGGGLDAFVARLDPSGSALSYSTYLGGRGTDRATGIALDAAGSAYVTGSTTSLNFPVANALQSAFGGSQDAFITKLDAAGTLSYSTYLGGSGSDHGAAIAVDAAGNAYVTGGTSSPDFPLASPLQSSPGGGGDAFVAKLDAAGTALGYSTYLGGTAADQGNAIAVDAGGNAYVTGFTFSADFPTLNAVQPSPGGREDAFVAKLNATGSALAYSTYLGGSRDDEGAGIAVDAAGSAYVTGFTLSSNFPVVNAVQPLWGGGFDAFVANIVAPSDTIAPTTTAILAPTPNANGWNDTDVTVTVGATDNPGGSGVKEIHLSLSGAQTGAAVVSGDTRLLSITAEGTTDLTYFAVDNAGNRESPKTLTVRIDKTPPAVACSVTPNRLWPPNHKMVPVTAIVTVSDAVSGAAGFVLTSVTSNGSSAGVDRDDDDKAEPGDIEGFDIGTADTSGRLRAERSEHRTDRVYTLTYAGMDLAGNSARCSATVTVPHGLRRRDTHHSSERGWRKPADEQGTPRAHRD